MKRRWRSAAVAALVTAGCVSFDPAGPPVPDITGLYTVTVALTLTNEFEIRNDTLMGTAKLRDTGYRGRFEGTFAIAPDDSGPFEGALQTEGEMLVTSLGPPPKPIAGVQHIEQLYSWCEFALLGMPPVTGTLAGDTLRVAVDASVPCLYQLAGVTQTVHTQLQFRLSGTR